jgi:hypothetical protein
VIRHRAAERAIHASSPVTAQLKTKVQNCVHGTNRQLPADWFTCDGNATAPKRKAEVWHGIDNAQIKRTWPA